MRAGDPCGGRPGVRRSPRGRARGPARGHGWGPVAGRRGRRRRVGRRHRGRRRDGRRGAPDRGARAGRLCGHAADAAVPPGQHGRPVCRVARRREPPGGPRRGHPPGADRVVPPSHVGQAGRPGPHRGPGHQRRVAGDHGLSAARRACCGERLVRGAHRARAGLADLPTARLGRTGRRAAGLGTGPSQLDPTRSAHTAGGG